MFGLRSYSFEHKQDPQEKINATAVLSFDEKIYEGKDINKIQTVGDSYLAHIQTFPLRFHSSDTILFTVSYV